MFFVLLIFICLYVSLTGASDRLGLLLPAVREAQLVGGLRHVAHVLTGHY